MRPCLGCANVSPALMCGLHVAMTAAKYDSFFALE